MLLNARRLDQVQFILLAIEDITEREQAFDQLRTANAKLAQRSQQVQTLASELTLAEQRERHRIALRLHDDLQQQLFAVLFQIQTLRSAQATEEGDLLGQLETQLTEALQTTRTLTVDLSPPILRGEGLVEAMRWLVTQMKEVYGLQVTLTTPDPPPVLRDGLRILIFQIVRELLFNVVKHAQTNQASVNLSQEGDQLRVTVADEGVGFDVEQVLSTPQIDEGMGLQTIRERLTLFEGELVIEAVPGAGVRAIVSLPLAAVRA
jgi:signal transduction histidine kinase